MSKSAILNRLCGRQNDDDTETDTPNPAHRQQAMGILSTTDEIREWFTDAEVEQFVVEVTADQVAELRETEWFDTVSHDGRDACGFVQRYSEETTMYVEVRDTDDMFTVEVSAMVVDEITNETIEAFCWSFGRSIAAEFDPLAERYDEPRMVVQPW